MIVETAERFGGRRIDRIGSMDLTVLATDRGSVPMNIGAVLEFGTAGGPSLDAEGSPGRTSADDSPAASAVAARSVRLRPTGVGR